MRKIKFRCRIDTINEMMYGEPALRVLEYDLENRIPVMQYTGLLDKNGKEIYEGDILSIPIDFCNLCEQKEMRLVVVFDYGKFVMSGKNVSYNGDHNTNYDMFGMNFGREDFTIIGNIYENPELLSS